MSQDLAGKHRVPRASRGSRAGVAFGLALVLILGVGGLWYLSVESFRVPSSSMVPEFQKDQRVLLRKRGLSSKVHPGEVVVYSRPGAPETSGARFIGRVVAEAGDRIAVQTRRIIVNGKILERVPCNPPQFATVVHPPGAQFPTRVFSQCDVESLPSGPSYRVLFDETTGFIRPSVPELKVPEGAVYVLGDNRDHSEDSRQWGPIPLSSVAGRVTRMPGGEPSGK